MSSHQTPLYDELWDMSQPAATERHFHDRLSQTPADFGEGHLQLLTQIARAQGLQRQFDAAHKTLDEVESHLSTGAPVAHIRYQLERGRVFNSSGHPDKARPFFMQALDAAQTQSEDFYAVDAAHMLAIVASPDEALGWNRRAMQIAEASESPYARRWLGSLYNNIGWAYHDLGDYAQALDTFERALAWFEQRDPPAPERVRIARWTVARALRSLKRHDEALAILRTLEGKGDGYVDEEIGENLLEQGDPASAAPHFAKAYALLSTDEWLQANDSARLERMLQLSRPTGQ